MTKIHFQNLRSIFFKIFDFFRKKMKKHRFYKETLTKSQNVGKNRKISNFFRKMSKIPNFFRSQIWKMDFRHEKIFFFHPIFFLTRYHHTTSENNTGVELI